MSKKTIFHFWFEKTVEWKIGGGCEGSGEV